MAGRALAADEPLLLDVWVNGFTTGKIGEFVMRDGKLFSRPQELRDLGFKISLDSPAAADGLLGLATLPGVTWRIDVKAQILYVTATNAQLQAVRLDAGARSVEGRAVESGTGAALNYDLTGTSVGGHNAGAGLLDLRAFSPRGLIDTGLLVSAGGGSGGSDGSGTDSLTRLASTYSYSDPSSQRRYYLGDVISGGLAWTRPVRLGGVQVTSDFSMQPDLITFPVPLLSGSAAVPSTLDVLVNGTKLLSQAVGAGPFEIPQLPVVTGAGEISMTLTNALGKQVTVILPFYASASLLAPGLQTWSAQAGEVRRDYGSVSNDYGSAAASFTFRRGLSQWLTVESSGETTPGLVLAGGGAVLNLDNFIILNAAASGSEGPGRDGALISAGFQRLGRTLSFGGSVTIASPTYTDIAAVNGSPVPTRVISTTVGWSLGRFGTLGLAYVARDIPSFQSALPNGPLAPPMSSPANAAGVETADRARVLSVSYSTRIRDMTLSATAFRDSAKGGANQLTAGVTIPLGTRTSVSYSRGSGSDGRDAQFQAEQSATVVGNMGYSLFAGSGTSDHQFAQVDYKSPVGLLSAGFDRNAGTNTLSVEAQGAVAFADRGLFFTNTIDDSFAVVDTDGLKGVHVLSENRDAGVTDSAGKLLVPDLRSFDINHIAIVATDVPIDVAIGVTTLDVRPQNHSGVVVDFRVHVSHGALLRIVDAAGAVIPLGSAVTLRSSGVAVPVGYDGAAYVEELQAHNTLAVILLNGSRCGLSFDYKAVKGEIPTIGPLRCLREDK